MAEQVAEPIRISASALGIDRVAVIIVFRWQATTLTEALAARGFASTVIDATGGLLQEGMVTMVAGLPHQDLPAFFSVVRAACPVSTRYVPYDAEVELPWQSERELVVVRTGGANVFVLPVESFVQL